METKKEYRAPELTVVAFMAEHGYAPSDTMARISMLSLFDGSDGSGEVENWSYDNDDQTFGSDNISWY